MANETLSHQLGVYQKCLTLPVEQLKGKYQKAFENCKTTLKTLGYEYIKENCPGKDSKEGLSEEGQEKWNDIFKLKMNLLFCSLYGYVNLEGVPEDQIDEVSAAPFYKAVAETSKYLTDWKEPVKPAPPKKVDMEGAAEKLSEVEILPAGCEISTYTLDFTLKEEQSGKDKKFLVIDKDGNEKTLTSTEITRVTADKPLYKSKNSSVAEDNYLQRHKAAEEEKEEVKTETTGLPENATIIKANSPEENAKIYNGEDESEVA